MKKESKKTAEAFSEFGRAIHGQSEHRNIPQILSGKYKPSKYLKIILRFVIIATFLIVLILSLTQNRRFYNIGYTNGIDEALDSMIVIINRQIGNDSMVSMVEIYGSQDTAFYILQTKSFEK